jgi:hypothetical protein
MGKHRLSMGLGIEFQFPSVIGQHNRLNGFVAFGNSVGETRSLPFPTFHFAKTTVDFV